MGTFIEEAVKKAQQHLEEQKDKLLMERVMILDPYYNPEKEAKKMFPRIKCVRIMDNEIWYWNNGTDEGYRIITFRMMPMTDTDMMNSGREFKFNFTYF